MVPTVPKSLWITEVGFQEDDDMLAVGYVAEFDVKKIWYVGPFEVW